MKIHAYSCPYPEGCNCGHGMNHDSPAKEPPSSGSERRPCSALRPPREKAGTIRVRWAKSKEEPIPDWWVSWGEGATKPMANHCLMEIRKLGEELARHGYDIKTLRFEIQKAPPVPITNWDKTNEWKPMLYKESLPNVQAMASPPLTPNNTDHE